MRTVAFYGFATLTREGIWQSKADEIWSVIWAYKYKVPRLDRLLEMHPIWLQARSKKPEYKKARDHWKWLKNNHTIPIYMLVQHPSVPMAVRYPIEAAQELVPPARRKAVFTSSFDFLMAMAIVEGFDRIEPYGFDMGSDTEYRYQREGAAYWIGYCDAHGIDLVLPSNTRLLSKRLYGYEGGSMIYRQDLERMKGVREQQKVEAFARLNGIEGRLNKTVQDGEQGSDYFRQLQDEWNEQYKMALIITGALQECEYYLKEIDLEEPELELENPTNFIKA
jgi:hypothetical protein